MVLVVPKKVIRIMSFLKDAQCGGKANPATAKPFGSSTPSSLIPIKPNSSEEDRKRVGGQPKGHPGHGRKSVPDGEADEVAELPRPASCPVSGLPLTSWTTRTRTVVHMVPARRIVRNCTIYRAWCPLCGKYHESEVPGVMPYFAFTNDLISQVLVDHFRAGIPLGTLARRAGVKKTALKKMAHKVAKLSQVFDAIGRDKKANVSELLWGPKTQPANVAKA